MADLVLFLLLPSLLLIFGFAFGWNNSGLTTGSLSNLLNYNLALVITLVGLFAGLAVAGGNMSSSILGKLVSPNLAEPALIAGLVVSITLLIVLTLLKIPVSLSNTVVGSFVGAGLAAGTGFKAAALFEIVASWIGVPFVCALLTIGIYEATARIERDRSLVEVSYANRVLLVITVFFVAFTLGANNIGLIASFSNIAHLSTLLGYALDAGIFVASAIGVVLFGKSIAEVVGGKIVELSQVKTLAAMLASAIITGLFTLLSVPISLTQVIIGGMLGAGVSQKPSLLNRRELGTLVLGWTLVTIASFGLSFGLSLLFLRLPIS